MKSISNEPHVHISNQLLLEFVTLPKKCELEDLLLKFKLDWREECFVIYGPTIFKFGNFKQA